MKTPKKVISRGNNAKNLNNCGVQTRKQARESAKKVEPKVKVQKKIENKKITTKKTVKTEDDPFASYKPLLKGTKTQYWSYFQKYPKNVPWRCVLSGGPNFDPKLLQPY